MPSDFEREYKDYIENSTPDFWDKIEAGIADSASAQSESVTEPVVTDAQSVGAKSTGEQSTVATSYVNRDKKVIRWGVFAKRAGQIAAAIALVFVAYTLVQVLAKGGMKSASPTMSESAAPAAAAEAPAEAMAEAAEPVYDDMGPMAESAEAPVDYEAAEPMAEAAQAPEDMAEAVEEAADATAAENSKTEDNTLGADSNAIKSDRSENNSSADSSATTNKYKQGLQVQTIELAVLEEMIELPPNEKTNSSSGEQYKYGLTFVSGDETIKCVFTEADVKRCAEQGIHLKKGESYEILVQPRGDHGDKSTSYPYLIKSIKTAE
ncbi:MAG: hypothetical protein K5868_09615 [Lachnospiraceae bacterium]|nr:hypothetical protein [Lachnospiraceae bacterium]